MIKTQPALRWTSEPIKILGITLTPELTKVAQKNIKPLLEKVKKSYPNLVSEKTYPLWECDSD